MSKDVLSFFSKSSLVDAEPSNDNDDGNANDQIIEEFKQNAKDLAIKYACEYFKGKSLHIGGEITEQILFNQKRISLMLNSDMLNSIDMAHKGIASHEELVFKASLDGADGRAKMIIDILDGISNSPVRIPKEFAGGLLLLHLELIEGVIF